jgi:hypothetical protein
VRLVVEEMGAVGLSMVVSDWKGAIGRANANKSRWLRAIDFNEEKHLIQRTPRTKAR